MSYALASKGRGIMVCCLLPHWLSGVLQNISQIVSSESVLMFISEYSILYDESLRPVDQHISKLYIFRFLGKISRSSPLVQKE